MSNTIITILLLSICWSIYITYKQDATFKKFLKGIVKYFLRILFNDKDERIIIAAFDANYIHQKYWFINNVAIPLIILYLPYVFTLINEDFGSITFHKTFQNLTLTGSLTMLGINVMRANLTSVSEELQNDDLKDDANFQALHKDTESLKSKLRSWVLILTIIGTIFYFIQVGGFIISDHPKSYIYIIIIFFIVVLSIFFARILSVIQSNFAKNETFDSDKLVKIYEEKDNEFYNLSKEKAETGGLIE